MPDKPVDEAVGGCPETIRVFPRRNNATPDDGFFTGPPLEHIECNEVHVSCTFTEDRRRSEFLAKQWKTAGYSVKIGGPAYGDRGGDFVSGRYIKEGYTITSRGCNNHCGFCYVWRREGRIREIPIVDGWNVLDSNLLQCSEGHIRAVFDMLKRQARRPVFTGGLEAALLKDWHVELLKWVRPESLYLAYDEPEDYEPLVLAAAMLAGAKVCGSHKRCCYVLIGYLDDTVPKALKRMKQVLALGLTPMAMLYRGENRIRDPEWVSFQARWANPWKIYGKKKVKAKYALFPD